MSFGFGVGDVITVLRLFERITREIQQFHGAPRHFQELQVELGLMKRTLSHILEIQPQSPHETASIEQIRAIALHCQQPLLDFIGKMRQREPSLGHFRTAGTLAAFGTRLHWSLVSRADVEALRRVLLSEMLALNVLLGTHQLQYLQSLQPIVLTRLSQADNEMKAVSTKIDVLGEISKRTPSAIIDLRNLVISQNTASTTKIAKMGQSCDEIRHRVDSLSSMAVKGRLFSKKVSRTLLHLFSILQDISRLLPLILQFSQDALSMIRQNASMLLNIQETMRRMAQGIESIPLHLSLPIIRLDDALGESWALPYQACSDYTAFRNLVEAVVFPDGRPGSRLVRSDKHGFSIAQSRAAIHACQWVQSVKPGAHIRQGIIPANFQDGKPTCLLCGSSEQISHSVSENDIIERTCAICRFSSIVETDRRTSDSQEDLSNAASALHSPPETGGSGSNHSERPSTAPTDPVQRVQSTKENEAASFHDTDVEPALRNYGKDKNMSRKRRKEKAKGSAKKGRSEIEAGPSKEKKIQKEAGSPQKEKNQNRADSFKKGRNQLETSISGKKKVTRTVEVWNCIYCGAGPISCNATCSCGERCSFCLV